jgi:sulfane dehydrogenase subunit SoxC
MGAAAAGALTAGPNLSHARELGVGRRPYGDRSSFETAARSFNPSATPGTGSSRTPLQDLHGIITPSSLHFERHHSGVPAIDPKKHQLLIDGLVRESLVFSIEDLLRLPSVSRIHFIECAGNSGREHEGNPAPDVQKSHGLLSCSEWTGVPLKTFAERGGNWLSRAMGRRGRRRCVSTERKSAVGEGHG